ncbi:phytoene/squalene synthase family protein [Roseibium sp. RKSG952]|uniref:phytoene/squalene synthase family protein n=1 Tax=Roseibium sp. RKSG952 TaxID=2529384 RepID=UPI0012BBF6A6|nr:phytoene/squalene synthase family protein [Roseibium sp. RKSG952]MTH98770.1 phytoene/squalene synthase family protein [Roseibium sp. RKSG952]
MLARSPEAFRLAPDLQLSCDLAINDGSKSFMMASLLLPRPTRCAARALYAFCRNADDLIDQSPDPAQALDQLQKRLDAIYADEDPAEPCDRAFQMVVRHFAIPRLLPDALIEGFAWDAGARTYQSFGDVKAYAARVASTVGVMMTLIMGSRDETTLARAADLGLAMQLTNIARDVGEDALNGRVYLPLDWLPEHQHDLGAFLSSSGDLRHVRSATRRLLEEADTLYARALTGVAGLPLGCRIAIASAGLIYQAIGREVAGNGYDSISKRAFTSSSRKLALVGRACLVTGLTRHHDPSPPDPAAAFLVVPCAQASAPPVRGLDAKAARMLELIALAEIRRRETRDSGELNA